ncbi:MAG TPA: transcriptional repressor [Myxococcota bacterium]|nr:transcriptional repressor [Myxococcota bacterium]
MAHPADDRVATELAARGLRATRQRVALLRLLRRSRVHPTAAELHRSLLAEQPSLSLKTVYDILDSLVSANLASCVTDGGQPYRYEAQNAPHYHARCRVCGRLYDLEARSDAHIRGRSDVPDGFVVERISVTLVGRCPRCGDSV